MYTKSNKYLKPDAKLIKRGALNMRIIYNNKKAYYGYYSMKFLE